MRKINSIFFLTVSIIILVIFSGCASMQASSKSGSSDPLPSWNDGGAKQSILNFVEGVTDPSSADYVNPEERIATFDNDGTLWVEKPLYVEVAFTFQRIAEMAKDHPEWKTTQPFKAVLEQDFATIKKFGSKELFKLVLTTHTGMTETQFKVHAKTFHDAAQNPKLKKLNTELVYQPMLELMSYLRDNDFKVFICSGGTIEFIRAFSERVYGVPSENVIGTSVKYQFNAEQNVIDRIPELNSYNDKKAKPENIQLHIGRRPILACGNSDGDLAMLQFADDSQGPALMLLVHHDDAEREFDYDKGTEKALDAAAEKGWTVVSMKEDFKKMYPFSDN
ncbi:MAG: HAD family hydrolase [Thermodesulfobacteriota bacterium]